MAVENPNIVLILADDLGYGDLGCYGATRLKTPHLDRLAREGLRLTDFHSNGFMCSPTRAALLTGRYQQRSGIAEALAEKSHGLRAEVRTIAEYLQPASVIGVGFRLSTTRERVVVLSWLFIFSTTRSRVVLHLGRS